MVLLFPTKPKAQINLRNHSRDKGFIVEDFVADYLQQYPLLILARNFQCRLGEIDIIFEEQSQNEADKTLVFLEVRFRKNTLFGGPLASIDWKKQRKIIHTAEVFLKFKPNYRKYACRFDVIGVTIDNNSGLPKIEWVKNAFQ